MLHIQKKNFNQLPTVKRFFERVKEEDGTFKFQDVPVKSFEQAKEGAKHTKDTLVAAIKNAVTACLENAETAPETHSTMILNTEGWLSSKQDDEFGIERMTAFCDFYRVPLERAEFSRDL